MCESSKNAKVYSLSWYHCRGEQSEKESLAKVLEGIESGVVEAVVRTGKSFDSVKLWKKWSIPRFNRYRRL